MKRFCQAFSSVAFSSAVVAGLPLSAIVVLALLGCSGDAGARSGNEGAPSVKSSGDKTEDKPGEAQAKTVAAAEQSKTSGDSAVAAGERGQAGTATSAQAKPAAASASKADSMDWPNWRGPEQNGISREVGLIDTFDPTTGKNVLWKRPDMGTRSTPIVMNGKLYALAPSEMTTPREGEKVYCLDAATGKTIWEQRFNVYLSDVPSERTAWSNVAGDAETGNVYALGVCGLFQCFDGETGKVKWKHSLHEEFGLLSTYGGRTNTPVVFEDLVIISSIVIGWGDMARPTHRCMAFDKRTGEMIWFAGTRPLPYDTNYSTPSIKVLGGQMAMVFGSGDGAVWALQPRTGRQIWKYQVSPFAGLNVSPLIVGDMVYMAQSDENRDGHTMGAVAAVNGALKGPPGNDITEKGEQWLVKEIVVNRSSPLLIDDRLYIFDDRAKLWIFDAKTGKQLGATPGAARKENYALGAAMRASPLYADGKIYIATMDARWHVLKPTEKGVAPVKQGRLNFLRLKDARFADDEKGTERQRDTECYGSAIASHGRIYLPTTECLYCLADSSKEPKLGQAPTAPAAEAEPAMEPAQVQVIPCEAVLEPGKTQKFRVRLYNAAGQFLKESPAEFSVAGAGKIAADGTFTADAGAKHQPAIITAKVGEVSGTARVRVIPPLPWSFDLTDGVPITWIGMRFRHIPVDSEVLQALRQADAKDKTQAADLYEALMFYGGPKVTFSDAAPPRSWSALVTYLGKDPAAVTTLDAAKEAVDPSLKALTAKKIVADSAWAMGKAGPQLTVTLAEQSKKPSQAIYKLSRIFVPGGVTQLGVRSQGFIGPADMHDYTIEADVMATVKPGTKVGEFGINAQGYTLAVLGTNRRLQVHTWAAQATPDPSSRGAKRIENFDIKPDTWYRMKLSVANQGDKAVARGKIWPRGEKEPADWMLTFEDATPNRTGAPGFFGNARDPASPFYIDNVVVKANE
jgi:outer membrane protein assembly factor BamB